MIQNIICFIIVIIAFYSGREYGKMEIRRLLNFDCGDPDCILCCHKSKDQGGPEDVDNVYSH